ncbi:MAG: ABC transporter permease [Nitrospina sp.]|jgi:cell division transport system permease protein|nr:ABC transporter permease [Nitrospina sp.]
MQTLLSGFRTTLSNILNNRQIFLLSVATITISISILGLFLLLFFNLNGFLSKWNSQVQLIVYLEDDITAAQRGALKGIISNAPNIESMAEVSRQKAWAEFQSNISENLKPLMDLDFNPLPASYKIKFKNTESRLAHIRELSNEIKGKSGVESVEYGVEWIERFEKFMVFSQVFLFSMGALLCLALTLIISNTIRLSIYSRQAEIELMLLIGATPRFVKIPFLLEGMLQGLIGSILALFLIGGAHFYLKSEFQSSIESMAMEIEFIAEPFLLGLVGMSVFVGFMASYISTFQFLRMLNKK